MPPPFRCTSTPDRDRNLAAADRLTRAAAGAGAELVVLPEKWPALGTPEQTRRSPSRSTVPRALGERDRARAGDRPGRRLVHASAEGASAAATRRSTSARTARRSATYRKIHMFDVEVGGRVYKESEHEAPGEEIVLSETAGGTSSG